MKTLLSFSLLCGLHATEEDTPVVSPLESAQKAQLEGRYDESVHLFQAVLEKDPENVLAKQGLKESERQQKQLHKKQMAQERKNIVLVENDLEEGRWVEAHDRVVDILSRVPDHSDALLLKGVIYVKAEREHDAARPASARWIETQGVLAYLNGDWSKAVESWQRILEINPKRTDLNAWLSKAQSHWEVQKRIKRIDELTALARTSHREGRFADARDHWTELLRLDPESTTAKEGLEKAVAAYDEEVQDQKRKKIQDLQVQALDAAAVGNRPESIRFWKEITELDPENTLANDFIKRFTLRQRAIDHFDQKRYEEALSEFEEILLLDTSDQEAMRYRKMARGFVGQNSYKEGRKALEVGDDEKAYDLLKQALRYNTNKQDIQKQLDRIESRLKEKHQVESQNLYKDALDAFLAGDMEKALSLTQKSLELDEENLEAKRLYERLTPRKGN